MEKLGTNCIHHLLVLNHCFRSICDIHYPRELVQFILMLYRNLIKVKVYIYNSNFILFVDTKIYHWTKPLSSTNPLEIAFLPAKKFACQNGNTMALTKDGNLSVWGDNQAGQLGLGFNAIYPVVLPRLQMWWVGTKPHYLKDVIQIKIGHKHTVILNKLGEVYTCGSNECGQLGKDFVRDVYYPVKISLPPIKKIACGKYHSMALSYEGEVYIWGVNDYNQLGLGYDIFIKWTPGKLKLENVRDIFCGPCYSMAITTSNKFYVWGKKCCHQLGYQADGNIFTELLLPPIKKIACGVSHTLALASDGNVYGWGYNILEGTHTETPTKLDLPPTKYIMAGDYISIFISQMNEIYIWSHGIGMIKKKYIVGADGIQKIEI
jgi:hypothetical protein